MLSLAAKGYSLSSAVVPPTILVEDCLPQSQVVRIAGPLVVLGVVLVEVLVDPLVLVDVEAVDSGVGPCTAVTWHWNELSADLLDAVKLKVASLFGAVPSIRTSQPLDLRH